MARQVLGNPPAALVTTGELALEERPACALVLFLDQPVRGVSEIGEEEREACYAK